ncbi:MAG: rhomboid family protein [Verrucomicrobia bacterium]|nr:MAG: rhomboid family protein [Verrucomicrobiota bacterium]
MTSLASQRCLLHPSREAAARCPRCRRAYCRECVTEHDGRLLCAACLRDSTKPARAQSLRMAWLAAPVHLVVGLFVAWTIFELLGWVLLRTPSAWHEGIPVERIAGQGP